MRRAPGGPAAVLALLLASACGDAGPTGPDGVDVTIAGPDRVTVVVGDTARLTATTSDPSATVTWSSSAERFARVTAGAVVALRPGTARVVAAAGGGADTVEVRVEPRPGGYTADEVDYFTEIALGFEFGSASRVVRRWGQPVRFRVNGDATEADRAQLARVVSEINALTSLTDMVEVEADPLVEIHFAPVSRFSEILPGYVPGNIGYFSVWFDGAGHFTRAVVLLASDREQEVRDHLIREEVTQILGLGRDSDLYPESIFYQPWSLVSEYAPVDRALVEMLYRPEVRPLMDEEAVTAVLRRLTRGVVAASAAAAAEPRDAGATPLEVGTASGGSR
ncbi:MAG: hypothetical protein AMXMBFR53_04570 [Gemmatimonadota bacterium]